jgi:hypothetical protein
MRYVSRRVIAAAVAGIALVLTGSAAYAAFTAPPLTNNTFNVPGDANGIPQSFTVTANGFPSAPAVFIEQCDGTNPATFPNWSPSTHCDIGTSPSPLPGQGASGTVSFPANDQNFGFIPVKGKTVSGGYACLSPSEALVPGIAASSQFRNCQVRVSTNNASVTTDQQFFTMVLPDGPNDTTTTTTTTTVAAPNPSCAVDGSTLKKGSSIKISKGLLPAGTGAVKPTKLGFAGDMTSCFNFDNVTTKIAPVLAGTFKAMIQVNPGSDCNSITPGAPIKSTLAIKFQAMKKGKLATAESDKTTVATLSTSLDPSGHLVFDIVGAPFSNPKSALLGKTPTIIVVTDQDGATRTTGCATPKKGLGLLTFNTGPSSITIS